MTPHLRILNQEMDVINEMMETQMPSSCPGFRRKANIPLRTRSGKWVQQFEKQGDTASSFLPTVPPAPATALCHYNRR